MLNKLKNTIKYIFEPKTVKVAGAAAEWKKVDQLKTRAKIAIENNGQVEWDEIVSIKRVGRKQVWDIEVEGSHNFVAGHYINHKTSKALTPEEEAKHIKSLNLEHHRTLSADDDIVFGGIIAHNTYLSGNLGIGTTGPDNLLDLEKAGTAKANLDILHITNTGNAADMDATETSILFNQYYYDASIPAVADAARISIGTEQDWTSTVSTQDAYIALETALDGTVTEYFRITSAGNVGVGTTNPGAKLDIKDASNPQLRLTQADGSVYGEIQIDGSGNLIFTTTGSSVTFTSDDITAGGDVTVSGNDIKDSGSNIVISFDGSGGIDSLADLTGSGRHSRDLDLHAEYPGAVLSAFYGAGTDTSITGTLTSDIEANATDNQRTYYEWSSSEAALNYYTVAIRVTLPQDFSAWATDDALVIDFVTETTDNTQNLLSVYVYIESDVTTAVASDTANAAAVADTWTTVTVDDSTLDDGVGTEWDAAGETAIIYLRMGSLTATDAKHVRVGDIKLNYLSKW